MAVQIYFLEQEVAVFWLILWARTIIGLDEHKIIYCDINRNTKHILPGQHMLLHVTVLYSFLNLKHNQTRNVQHVLWWVCNPPPQEAEHLEKVDQGDVSSQP